MILESDFFQRKFHVHLNSPPGQINHNDEKLHTIVYLQVAIISQALIFVTRSHGFFFMERPSYALMAAFCLAQLVSSIIAGFADWGFTYIQKISAAWIGIVWVWVSFLLVYATFLDVSWPEHHLVRSSGLDQVRDESYRDQVPPQPSSCGHGGRYSCRG